MELNYTKFFGFSESYEPSCRVLLSLSPDRSPFLGLPFRKPSTGSPSSTLLSEIRSGLLSIHRPVQRWDMFTKAVRESCTVSGSLPTFLKTSI